MDIFEHVMEKAKKAKSAARKMAGIQTAVKDTALRAVADAIIEHSAEIKEANERDIANADQYGLTQAMIDRLTLTDSRIHGMAESLREIASFPDPVGKVTDVVHRPSGIRVGRMTVPIGLIGFIYESRPNVTVDAAGISLKSGNAILLRGGKEAPHSNIMLAGLFNDVAVANGIPDGAVSIVELTDREGVKHIVEASGIVDIVI